MGHPAEKRVTCLKAPPPTGANLPVRKPKDGPEYMKMKSLILTAAVSVAVVSAAAPSASRAADDSGWYVRGDTGSTFNGHIDGANGPRSDYGWSLDAGLGRSFGNGWRAEGELLYLNDSGKRGSANTKALGGFANGYYDFLPNAKWRPFLGAGIGVAQVSEDRNGFAPHGERTVFAYQLHAGISHPFSDRLSGEVAYHYLGAPSVKFDSGARRVDGDFGASLVTVGLRYRFGG